MTSCSSVDHLPALSGAAPVRGPIVMVMGILNVTPDSFSDGGRFLDRGAAIAHGVEMVADGADIVDIGGESTRPGAAPVSEAEECRRVVPVIEALAPRVRVSIDTTKAVVARAAVAAGASLINDVSSSLGDVAAELQVGWAAMHRKGTPQTMQIEPHYDDVVAEVAAFLHERATAARANGVREVWIDPGIGFGKTLGHNLTLLRHLDRLVALGWPVLIGTSRKTTLGRLLAASDARGGVQLAPKGSTRLAPLNGSAGALAPSPPDDRLEGSIATATWAFVQGAQMARVHDVLPTVQAARVVAA